MSEKNGRRETPAGTPKKDGSGRGTGANRGRGGCQNPSGGRQGRNR